MQKKGGTSTSLYTIFVLIAVILLIVIIFTILKTKIADGIFGVI